MFSSRLLLFFAVLLIYLSQYVVHSATTISFESTESKHISKANSPVESIINVSGLSSLLSSSAVVTAQIWIAHTWNGDLIIRLYGPDGSYITISNRCGGNNANVFNGTLFTDSAPNSVSTYSFSNNIVVSPLRPEDPFSNFIGKNPNGKWKLWINDAAISDDGQLYGFILSIQGSNQNMKSENKYKK